MSCAPFTTWPATDARPGAAGAGRPAARPAFDLAGVQARHAAPRPARPDRPAAAPSRRIPRPAPPRSRPRPSVLFALAIAALAIDAGSGQSRGVQVLEATGGLPAFAAGAFEEPLGVQQLSSGAYVVFDRRAHALYRVDPRSGETTRIVDIGPEHGRLLGPSAFDIANDMIAVADAPNRVERIQFFNEKGQRLGGFRLPGRASPRVTLGTLVLSGVGSLEFTGRSLLVNFPETGALITEYTLSGRPVRSIGRLRPTGHEADRNLHLALNVGLPLADPAGGGFYFVFLTGEPRFRKYARDGTLVFERLMQGREIDDVVAALPSVWPTRRIDDEVLPLVPPVVRTAAVDPLGRLWVSFVVPYTYVFDEEGDKARTVQFRAGGIVAPTSLWFASRTRLLVTPGLYEFRVE